ncbi:MAG: precorrin-6y C5,15-methyltransferase (decarboxylating) subunit CbiE [Oscillospiraceae bacterium]|nr:precorrin-6y C5,15-methyltransferase (decarboxylating) subunit CbiE [Oscillospiraceae bacterium]
MKTVAVIGIGMSRKTLTAEALSAIQGAEVLLGAPRMLEEFSDLCKPSLPVYLTPDILSALEQREEESFAVLFSGDVGFYSGATKLVSALKDYSVQIYPGISSVVYFFSRCGRPWQNACLVSCHGLDTDLVSPVRRNAVTFALTGGNVSELAESLCEAGFGDLMVTVGQKLSYEDETLESLPVRALVGRSFDSLTVLLIDNPEPDDRVRSGIPDEEFTRAKVPMTKSEVRAVCLSRLDIRPDDICYDVGCGTGSVTVEMALAAYRGRVYAFDKKEEAVALTLENCAHFHIGNVKAYSGLAPEVFRDKPTPDVVFIGGSSGNLAVIMQELYERNSRVRFVVTAVSLETISEAIRAFGLLNKKINISEVSVSRTKAIAGLHMMDAQNPIFIMSAGE